MIAVVPGIMYANGTGKIVLEIPIDVDLRGYDLVTLQIRREFMQVELLDCKRLRRKFLMRSNGRDQRLNRLAMQGMAQAKLLCYNLAVHIEELTSAINQDNNYHAVYKLVA